MAPIPSSDAEWDERFPEHAKVKANQTEINEVGAFLDWCQEQGYVIAEDNDKYPYIQPISQDFERLIGDYIGVHTDAFRAEKDAIFNLLLGA